MKASATSHGVADALVDVRQRLADCRLSLEIAGVDEARETRRELTGQIEDYLLPRLRSLDAPLLVVVGGSTGAGKSTLVNSLVGAEVSAAGVLRPTTRSPVLICNPQETGWFSDERILPGLPRTSGRATADGEALHLVPEGAVPNGLALLDAPDIDSVVESNRVIATQLLAAADLWIFMTTAARYADAVPWEFLRKAQARSTALAIVLNRVPAEGLEEVPRHLGAMLRAEGLQDAPLFTIPETPLVNGMIPDEALAPVKRWLDDLAADAEARASVVRTTLQGALDSVGERVSAVATHVESQIAASNALRDDVARAYAAARAEIEDALSGGSLLRGEVLARWQDVVGTGEFMRTLETRIGWLRDRIRDAVMGEPSTATEVQAHLGNSVETVVTAAADRAAERGVGAWKASRAGKALLAKSERSLERSSTQLRYALDDELRAWQGHVLNLVRAEGASKRATARVLSFGVNMIGAALMVTVFAQTGGLTGAEVLVAGGTATVSQRLLEAVFGDQAVRTLTATARSDLLARVDRLLDGEAQRFYAVLREVAPSEDEARALHDAAEAFRMSRL